MKNLTFTLKTYGRIFILLIISGGAIAVYAQTNKPAVAPLNSTPTDMQASLDSAFTYQGELQESGSLANGTYDFEFKLYDDLAVGTQVGITVLADDVVVTNGRFTLNLDFTNLFDGTALYLEIGVRDGASGGAYTTLTPRQSLTGTPYALGFQPGVSVTGSGDILTAVTTSGSSNHAISGYANNGAGNPAGVYGETADTSGRGVEGQATSVTGSSVGVYGRSLSSTGYGMFAVGGLYGVKGQTILANGYGVWGSAGSAANSYGVLGQGNSDTGAGVWGINSASGPGVIGESTSGIGVSGTATSAEGVFGQTSVTNVNTAGVKGVVGPSAGVIGEATDTGYGVQGSGSIGVVGTGNGTFGAYGVYGQADNTSGRAVRGNATSLVGTTYGVSGESASTSGYGVHGEASNVSGTTYGVYGLNRSNGGYGVYGEGPGTGVYGESTNGGTGVVGSGAIGVTGVGTSIGSFAQTDHVVGTGAAGYSYATTGTNYGVYGRNISASGYGGYFENDSTTGGVALYAVTDANSGNIIVAANNLTTPDIEFRVDSTGNVYADVAFNGGGADYAEMMPAVPGLEPGDVLVIGPDGLLTASTLPFQPTVVGVYSTQPGFIAGGGDDEKDLTGHIPLGLMGVIPVKITNENGAIAPGDMLVSSSLTGHAMKAGLDAPQGTIIGKALAPFDEEKGVIIMLVILQ